MTNLKLINLSLFDIIINLSSGLIIFDRFQQKDHFRLIPKELVQGTLEAFISNKIRIRVTRGIFDNINLNNEDVFVIKVLYKLRTSWGKADGMSEPPKGMDPLKWDSIKKFYSLSAREDNYLLQINDLQKIYFVTRLANKNYFNMFEGKKLIEKILNKKLEKCFLDQTPINKTGSVCAKCRDILVVGYNIKVKPHQVGKEKYISLHGRLKSRFSDFFKRFLD